MQELENNGAILAQTELAVKDCQAAMAHMHWMIPQNNPYDIIPNTLTFVWFQEKRGWRALEGQTAIEADGFVMIRVFHPCFLFSRIEYAS